MSRIIPDWVLQGVKDMLEGRSRVEVRFNIEQRPNDDAPHEYWYIVTRETEQFMAGHETELVKVYDKLEMYRTGKYLFRAPPVCTAKWEDADWIKYIDAGNRWIID